MSVEIKSKSFEKIALKQTLWLSTIFWKQNIGRKNTLLVHHQCVKANYNEKVWKRKRECETECMRLFGFFSFCAKLLRIIYETNQTRLLRSFNWCKSKLNKSRTRWALFLCASPSFSFCVRASVCSISGNFPMRI